MNLSYLNITHNLMIIVNKFAVQRLKVLINRVFHAKNNFNRRRKQGRKKQPAQLSIFPPTQSCGKCRPESPD